MPDGELTVGVVGLDMSHALEFTRRPNDPDNLDYVPGARVIAGWPGGSKDFPLSWSRVGKACTALRC